MADITGAATGVRDIVGRYFSLLALIPSGILVLWIFLLATSGAWSGRPDVARALGALSKLGFGGAAALVLASIAVGLVLHPVQFGIVQVLEGYWGTTPVARRALVMRLRHHVLRRDRLFDEYHVLSEEIDLCERDAEAASGDDLVKIQRRQGEAEAQLGEISRILGTYPDDPSDTMPTRLGNVLRRYERTAGAPWGLDAVVVLPYLSRVAAPGDMDYVNDQRSQLDLAVRTVFIALLAGGAAVLFLARHGLWLLIALVPYGAAYLAYRGAVVVAAEYGRALRVLIALNRRALYERLHISTPDNSAAEYMFNTQRLLPFLQNGASAAALDYERVELDRRGYL